MDDFEKYAKKNFGQIDTDITVFCKQSKKQFDGRAYVGSASKILPLFMLLGIILVIAGFVVLFAGGDMLWVGLGMMVMGICSIVGTPKIAKLNKKGQAEYERAHGLKRYMLDFSNLKEYDIPQLVLWEEYLVYATMMGISKEVIKHLKLVYPEITGLNEQQLNGRGYIYTYVYLSNRSVGGASFDLGQRMDTAVSNIQRTVQTLAHPPKSSGGGGGGGFGGGGGGGRH